MNDMTENLQNRPWARPFGDDFDNIFQGFFRPLGRPLEESNGNMIPAVDVVDENDRYIINAELPGVDKKDISVSINDDVLTISAERRVEDEKKDDKGRVICRENRYGNYVRNLRLNNAVDAGHIKAKYKNGVLQLDLPKIEEAKPKKIAIEVH